MTVASIRKPKRPEGHPTLYKPEYCNSVVEIMGQGFSLTAFAGHIGVCYDTVADWTRRHPEFLQAVKRARANRLRFWEDKLAKCAPGAAVACIFALKNADANEWRDTSRTEITGANGGPVEIDRTDRDTLMVEAKKRGLKVVTRN